jgi:hypothetical protein
MRKIFAIIILILIYSSCKKDKTEPIELSTTYMPDLTEFRSDKSSPAYYVDAVNGNDDNDGRSSATAWKTLDRLHNVTLKPGDVVRLACGSVWTNQLLLLDNKQSGTEQSPIIIEPYGEGEIPTIKNPRALWDKSQAYYGVYVASNSSFINIVGIKILDTGAKPGIYLHSESHHVVIAGCEILNCGTGISVSVQNQRIIANYIHDIGSSGAGSGIGVVFVGKNLEIAWNDFKRCEVNNEKGKDGAALEFYNYTAAEQYDYLSENITLHHNTINNCLIFIECYGNVKNMVIAYNLYMNSMASGLLFHFDDCEHPTWTHECTYEVSIENNTFVSRMDANPGGWGVIGQLIDYNHKPDPAKSKMVVRNNIFMTNYRITTSNQLGSSFVHDHNIYHLIDGGKLGDFELGNNEFFADPLFENYEGLDFRLKSGSPAINAGANTNFTRDIMGNQVPNDLLPDIGAFEK